MANRIYANIVQKRKAIRMHDIEYKKRAYKQYAFRFHKKYDKDIIDTLEQQQNKQEFIKRVIRKSNNKN